MGVSEFELNAKRLRAEALRSEIASLKTRDAERLDAAEREVSAAALDGEIERLERELMATGRATGSTDAALEAMERAAQVEEQVIAASEETKDEPKEEKVQPFAHELLVEPRVNDSVGEDDEELDEDFSDDESADRDSDLIIPGRVGNEDLAPAEDKNGETK